jgi:hypothetical protein
VSWCGLNLTSSGHELVGGPGEHSNGASNFHKTGEGGFLASSASLNFAKEILLHELVTEGHVIYMN